MTPAQTALYFREWAQARAWYSEHGFSGAALEAKRHEITRRALGRDKSSKLFTNSDFTKVLAGLRAVHDGGNLAAQLHAEEDPAEQAAAKLHECDRALWDCYQLGDAKFADYNVRYSYIGGIARKVRGKDLGACTAADLAVVLGCLRRMLNRARKQSPALAAEIDGYRLTQAKAQPF